MKMKSLTSNFAIRLIARLPLFTSWLIVCSSFLLVIRIQAQSNYEPYAFTTLAGGGPGSADGTGSAARFDGPFGVTVDNTGNVYVADTANDTIRKITPTGVVSTFAGLAGTQGSVDGSGGTARFAHPFAVATDGAGNVYVADTFNDTVRTITPAGAVSTLAGSAGNQGGTDGTGSAARFNGPEGIAADGAGNVYVADSFNHTLRKITSGGIVTTFAGVAGSQGSADGTGSAARFNHPEGLAIDSAGNVYVADSLNQTIRKISSAGVVTTLAGLVGSAGSADGTGTMARFNRPKGVTADAAGNVYVGDASNHTIRKITSGGVVTTVAGLAGTLGSADGTGSAARFYLPSGVAVDVSGNVYVGDNENNTIRKITPSAVVTTLAGLASIGSADGPRSNAQFHLPEGVTVDSAGNSYVADTYNHTIRKITPAGLASTLAGLAGSSGSADGSGSGARFNLPYGVALDSAGNLYVADTNNNTIRKITPAGMVTTFAGLAGNQGSADGTGSNASFALPQGVAADVGDNVYVADFLNSTIRKITPGGVVTTLAGSAGNYGSNDGIGSAAQFYLPYGVTVDSVGNVYVADTNNSTIRKITPSGAVSTLAGLAGNSGYADGTGSIARFYSPSGVAVDASGNVYVADTYNNKIRKVAPGGVVTTLAGSAQGNADGIGSAAHFDLPRGLAVDASGVIYVADTYNNTLRIGQVPPPAPHAVVLPNGHLSISGTAPPNSSVQISATYSLNTSFSALATVTADGQGTYRFEDGDTASFVARFYKALIPFH